MEKAAEKPCTAIVQESTQTDNGLSLSQVTSSNEIEWMRCIPRMRSAPHCQSAPLAAVAARCRVESLRQRQQVAPVLPKLQAVATASFKIQDSTIRCSVTLRPLRSDPWTCACPNSHAQNKRTARLTRLAKFCTQPGPRHLSPWHC